MSFTVALKLNPLIFLEMGKMVLQIGSRRNAEVRG